MSVRKLKMTGNATSDPVIAWRTKRLRAAGFGDELAQRIAADCAYDLHAVLELIDRGCPAKLALRILAPLDAGNPPC